MINKYTNPARGIEHIGMSVPDLADAERFFIDAFDASVLYRLIPEEKPEAKQDGADMSAVNGIDPKCNVVGLSMMRLGQGPNVELFEIEGMRREKPAEVMDMGLTHFSLLVEDIEATGQAMEKAGATMLEGPKSFFAQEAGEGNCMWFGRTPWGTLIELVQLPVAPDYDEVATQQRWLPHPR